MVVTITVTWGLVTYFFRLSVICDGQRCRSQPGRLHVIQQRQRNLSVGTDRHDSRHFRLFPHADIQHILGAYHVIWIGRRAAWLIATCGCHRRSAGWLGCFEPASCPARPRKSRESRTTEISKSNFEFASRLSLVVRSRNPARRFVSICRATTCKLICSSWRPVCDSSACDRELLELVPVPLRATQPEPLASANIRAVRKLPLSLAVRSAQPLNSETASCSSPSATIFLTTFSSSRIFPGQE